MVSAAATAYAVNHVVLPSKLPQKDDRNVAHEVALFEIATHALESLKLHVDIEHVGSVIAAKATVDNLRATRDQNGNTSQLQLQTLLAQATNSGALGALPIEVKEQNAGILISRSSSHVNFEFFELSPKNDAAMSSGRLVRTFPGHASKIPIADIDPDLIESTSRTIATMTTQTAPGFQPQITKNKKAMDEQRDTSSPGLVTDFLMNIVTALGEPMDVHRITKNTREEVLWDNCLSPWRRSPLWLLLRVSLQLVLTRKSSDTRDADSLYKAFMVFLLARILDLVKIYWEDMGSETVHLVLAKLTRRLRKVELLKQDQCLRQDWAVQVHDSMSNAHEFIKKHWQNRIENSQAYIDVNSIASLKPKSDVDLDLSGLDAFLSSIKSRKREASLSAFTPASKHSALRSAELPKCEYLSNSGEGLHFRLCTFEEWVKHHLVDWAKTHLRDREACGGLRSIMVSYHNTANSVYAGTPIGMSIMYLTVAELWVACDTIACSIYPMLPEYDPEIDLTEFQCLVLPLKGHLQRLWGVECYVKSRRHAATEGRPSVYRKFGDISSFAVRYFELCKPMQTTLSKLEADAAIKRRQKCGELASLQREYRQCMDRYNSLECETEEFVYNTYHGYTEERHSGRCRKCAARTRADGLKIEIYEWPISSEASKAKATIFELLVPGSYGNWRDASAYFITTVLGYKDAKPQVPVYSGTLDKHHGISHLSSRYSGRRIVPLSGAKSHTTTHRDVKKAVALLKEDDVCLDSALQYAYYDTSSGCFTTDTLGCTSEVLKKCMYPMLKRSKALQPFMSRPPASPDGCHPNNVIAGLSDCPLHLSIDEYKALGTLSLGHNIIYSNVLAQLAIPSVDWTKIETQCIILQAVQQTGPPGQGSERSCHSILTESAFGHAMLEQLESNLGRIQMNWESFRAAATFSLLARRVLSLTSALDVRYRAFRYLESLRSACSGWLRRLKQRVAASTDDGQRTDLCSRATEIALLCTSTYDVEEADFGTVLRNETAISILLQSTTVVHEHHATAQSEFPELFSITLQSWRSLMVRIFPKLRSAILADGSGLSDAVKTSWAAFEISSGNSWSTLNRDQPQWLCTISGSLPVHFNLLTGELLVNGLPLAHLPVEYTQHAMYAPLFRKSALEVMPTNEAGLRFSAKSLHLGYKLHFGINGGDMLLCAIGHGKRLDLLPSRLFRDLIPESLVTHAVHMYDSHAQEVLFRPLYSPWSTEDDDTRWRLVRHGTSWRLVNKDKVMINVRSRTARTISKMLAPLEKPLHMHMRLLGPDYTCAEIELPRLQISFEFDENSKCLRSCQFRGMFVDPDQTIGALVGVQSRLMLRSAEGRRSILIPDGSFQIVKASQVQYPSVAIAESSASRTRAYHIDETLGQITGDGSLRSRLLLCYLHALTSHCLPDPLTGCTGSESAISILQSAAVRSSNLLTPEEIDLLLRIAGLSAARTFYPEYLKVMQSTKWDVSLPSLSQHASFRLLVSDLLRQAAKMRVFHPDKYKVFDMIGQAQKKLMSSSNTLLDQRAAARTASYQVAGFGAELFTSLRDVQYAARDTHRTSQRGRNALITAKMTLRDQFSLHSPIPNLKGGLLRKHFSSNTVNGASRSFDLRSLGYDSKWLLSASKHMQQHWCSLQQSLAASAVDCNRYDLATWLGTISFNDTADVDAIQAFASFYRLQDFSAVQPPALGSFQLGEGHEYHEATIRAILQNRSKSFDTSEEARLPRQGAETKRQHHTRILLLFETRQNNAIQKFISDLQSQWPVRSPTVPSADEYSTYLNVTTAMTTVRSKFQHWFNNRLFMQYLHNLSTIMARQATSSVVVSPYLLTLPPIKNSRLNDDIRHYSMTDIFATTPPPASGLIAPCEPKVTILGKHTPKKQVQVKDKLGDLCAKLMMYANSTSERRYVEDLQSSCSALDSHNDNTHEELLPNAQPLLEGYLSSCQAHFGNFQFALNGLLSRQVAYAMQLSPRICTKFWLSQLHKDRFDTLSPSWKETIIQYALAVTSLQRAQRLVRLSDKPIDLVEELGHVGHQNWDVNEFPETLLIEAESGILVRKEQEYIASQMRSPKDGDNIVLQLLMGGGKSTTILPILGAFHGNKEKLVRVVVAKPQSQQMLHMLVAKLGGLLNRKVYQMPFSRNIRLSAQDANTIREIYEECVRERGVLLIQPEHILSFKLMAVECVLTKQLATAQSMLATQKWFDEVSCDCIDESDENFSTKFELIYTMGNQSSVEYAPERWLIIQDILALLPNLAKQVKEDYPDAVDIQGDGDGRYPRIRFLRSDAADLILRLLATRVVESGVGSPSRSQSSVMQAAILRYISVKDLETHEIHTVEKSKFWTTTTKPSLLLLRGLFAGGVLKFIFSMKRSRVNFGLDKLRTPSTRLAVPFRSKDSPSPRSEYAHPDVIIILTLLSWYYEGLSDDDLFDTLTHVVHSDQSVIHYDEFVRTASSSLPRAFRQLTGVSLRDRHQCIMEVFPYLRYSKKAVDYYLSYLVFPKELKQFPLKLSASGWDLATQKPNPTTGFSGTNDTMHLLPLNMHHLDLPSQQHTNARVLSYLLMDETSVANLPARTVGCTDRDGQHLLAFIERLSPDIRVFLDCGASILEMNNREVAETWLKLRDDDVLAVIYFENEELSVLDRTSKVESFQTSPYAKMLDSCIVYLDESHTRGTDIPGLPRHYRAALTLGSQLTKDRLTQAAMRLRKLGNGQSVCFVVPGEIQTKIWEQNGKPTGTTIEVHDVLAWAIGETWSDLRRTLPLWAVQGNRFESHRHLLVDGAATTKRQAKAFLEKEAASLETRYMPRKVDNDGSAHISRWDMSNQSVSKIVSRCRDFEAMGFGSAALSEEQERELAPEIEEERQIERPSRLKAHPHNLHQDLKRLVDTGKIDIGSKAWKPAFKALDDTSAGRLTDLSKFPDDLLVTRDFIRTVEVPPGSTRASFKSDSYQRPVQFILSVPSRHRPGVISNLIIISPWEANQLLPQLRQSKTISLHIFAPRSNVSYASLDELTLYTVGRVFSPGSVPRSLTIQLNLFAGSLYLRSLSEYTEVCDHLGLLTGTAKDGQQVYADGFIDPPSGIWGLKKSPVPFLRALLLRIRRGGEGVEKTHMGRVLDGIKLEESDFAQEE